MASPPSDRAASAAATAGGKIPARGRRVAILAVLVAVMLAVGTGYVLRAAEEQRQGTGETTRIELSSGSVVGGGSPGNEAPAELLVRSTALGPLYGRMVRLSFTPERNAELVGDLECDRLHVASERGLCLRADRGAITTYEAAIFGADGRASVVLPLSGSPSRTRVSADGRLGAVTVFVTGHSYAAANFSTQTSLIDMEAGELLVNDLERFRVTRDGVAIDSPDFNFWGVTFASDSNRFYATLGTGGRFFLVEGDVRESSMRVIYEGLECPSLSPDETRIAFKKRTVEGGRLRWQPAILDLASMTETLLPEARSVDDQIEWLDDQSILYALPETVLAATAREDVWVTRSDGASPPRLLVQNGYSPAVQRR